jgi:dipeptide/tripeptide permease
MAMLLIRGNTLKHVHSLCKLGIFVYFIHKSIVLYIYFHMSLSQKITNVALVIADPLLQKNLGRGSPFNVSCCKKHKCIENFIWNEPLLRGHPSYKATFSLSQRWPPNTGLTTVILLTFKCFVFKKITIDLFLAKFTINMTFMSVVFCVLPWDMFIYSNNEISCWYLVYL